jgi:hypothetical protein
MIGSHAHPGYLPPWQVGHHAAPRTRAKIIDCRAATGRRGDGVKVDSVDHGRRQRASSGRDGLGHDTRDGASASWSPLSGM